MDPDRLCNMMARYLAPVILTALADDDVTEVYVNPQDGRVRLDTHSRGKVDTEVRLDASRVEMFLNAVAIRNTHTLTIHSPSIQAELPMDVFHGSRLQGFLPPLTVGPCFTLRKRPTTVYSLDHYVQRGLLTERWYTILGEAIETYQNLLIIGGTNTGKTTFANAVLHEIARRCPCDRLVILEDTIELQCTAPDHLALRTAPGTSLAQLVKMTLRVSPNRIIVGEVRDAAALDLLDAWATGHPGGVATFHATDPAGALLRLDRLAQRANVPSQAMLIAEAVNLIVVMAGGAAGRRVVDLVRVHALRPDGTFHLQHYTEAGACVS
jgi:type IV secretion system protein VirB11